MPRAKNGLLTKIGVVWQKLDFLAKDQDFVPKNQEFVPKKRNHFLGFTMFRPRLGKVVQRKKLK